MSNKSIDGASVLLIGAIVGSIMLLVFAVWAPSTRLRATVAGRVAFDHRTDLVAAGVAAFLISLLVYLVTQA